MSEWAVKCRIGVEKFFQIGYTLGVNLFAMIINSKNTQIKNTQGVDCMRNKGKYTMLACAIMSWMAMPVLADNIDESPSRGGH